MAGFQDDDEYRRPTLQNVQTNESPQVLKGMAETLRKL